jgi:UDP-N-acetylmuramoyl-tripeptide--D-alanyl-D-alanine ligase
MEEKRLFTWQEAAAILDCGLFMPKGSRISAGFNSVAVDSRRVEPQALFVALRGARTDGRRFVESAFQAGAAGALVEDARNSEDLYALIKAAEDAKGVLLMAYDTLFALRLLAKAYLEKFPGLLRVGVTGSSGKTTTKEIAAAMIGKEKRVIYNEGNLNSDIGLPLSLFRVRTEHEVGVFELGMNRPGEIAEIAGTLRPHFALITNTGTAHIGIIGTKAGIAQEKKNIFSFFTGEETAFIPADAEYAAFLAEGVNGRICFFSRESCGMSGIEDRGISGWEMMIDGEKAVFPLPGYHNLQNAAAAITIARAVGVGREAIIRGLASVKPLSGRSEVIKTRMGGRQVTVVCDCYNANPDSMEKALAFFESAAWNGGKIVVVGEMGELGAESAREHERLFQRLEKTAARKKYFFRVSKAVFPAGDTAVYDDMEQLKKEIHGVAEENDLILLKGSRLCALERILS